MRAGLGTCGDSPSSGPTVTMIPCCCCCLSSSCALRRALLAYIPRSNRKRDKIGRMRIMRQGCTTLSRDIFRSICSLSYLSTQKTVQFCILVAVLPVSVGFMSCNIYQKYDPTYPCSVDVIEMINQCPHHYFELVPGSYSVFHFQAWPPPIY